jgi:NADH-quinone oxidoreductase subunit G
MPEDAARQPSDAKEESPPTGEQPKTRSHAAAPGDRPPEAEKPPDAVSLTIDGRPVSVPKGTLVVEAAKRLGIEIPVFCYHHKLDPVGACRLCLVEIQPGPPKPQTACTTPAAEGMTVRTQSPLAVAGRADILEFELVNHPLDCPVCDKGGECPLQDYSFRHAYPVSRIDQPRVHFRKPIPLSEFIALDRERCVLCYRCTRYYDEIAWEQELTTDQRGVDSFITSQFDQPLKSVFSGNIIDLCPVGALTSRVWRFESRPWDMEHAPSVCSKCSVGCNVTLWQRRQQLVRVTSHENDEIDDGWICDRGRFDYTHVNDPCRVEAPEVGGRRASWDEAMQELVAGVKSVSAARLGLAIPQDITNEEAFLLSRLLRGPWKGARVVMQNRSLLPRFDGSGLMIRDFERVKVLVVVASDTRDDVPIINLRLKKAARRGVRLLVVHPEDLDLDRGPNSVRSTVHVRYEPGRAAEAVRALRDHELLGARPVGILYGDGRGREDVAALAEAVGWLAAELEAPVLPLYRATNERGALETGILDGARDLEGVEALLSWGPPPHEVPASAGFVAAWDTLKRPTLGSPAVLIPHTSFAETQGSYTNVEGRVQFLRPVLPVEPPRRESWDVLSELSTRFGVPTDYLGIRQVQLEAAAAVPALAALSEQPPRPRVPIPTVLGAARP